ncbi:tetratricopeptide repeat protein [Pontibacter sp. MBLB2868]|uniref:tetratricopeptide repeat protein n=1 Tax=Pontibacter sp. MBLB2868 TaxID=3451555 RepID=UPI003F756C23
MRNWIVAVGMLVGISACNSQNAITENHHSPEKPILTLADVVPVKQPKTKEQKARQQKFIKEDTKRFKNRKLAGEYYVLQAQRNFNANKIDSAAFLFGRAWLMDSTNNDVFWGYGKVYGQQKKYDKALFILYRALEKDDKNPRLLTDVATSHLNRFYETSSPEDLMQSKKLLEKALKLSSDKADAYYKLAITSYYLSDYGQAWNYLHKSVQKQKDIADKTFIAALLDKQRDPQGVYATPPKH